MDILNFSHIMCGLGRFLITYLQISRALDALEENFRKWCASLLMSVHLSTRNSAITTTEIFKNCISGYSSKICRHVPSLVKIGQSQERLT